MGTQFFGTIALIEFVLKTRDNSSASQYVASSQRSSPPAISQSFHPPCRHSRIAPSHRSSPQAISHGFPSVHPVVTPVSLLPTGALPKLFPTVYPPGPPSRHSRIAPSHRSSPQAISHGFPSVHPVVTPVSLLPTGALPKLFPTVSLPCTLSSLPYRSFPTDLSPTYFPRFPFRPPSRHSRIAPSHRTSPPSISHGFPSVHPVVIPVLLLPTHGFASYLHGFLSVQHAVSLPPSEALPKLFARFPLRPACCLAPSQQSSPQAISTVSCPSSMLSRSLPAKLSASYLHGFQSVQHCLAPSQRSFPQAICTVSSPSSMLSRSLPAKLSPSYLHGFLSVQHAVSLPPSEALRKLFARFPPVQHAVSLPPGEVSASYFHGFLSVQHAVSLPPSEALPKLFPRFPVRPACCLAPSQRSSPQAICTVSSPSSMLSRFLPAKLSASYLPRFQSVQHAVSLPPSEALRKLFPRFPVRPAYCVAPPSEAVRKLFARFPLRPACCLAPSQRSCPEAISTASCPSSTLSRSLPAKLSESYLYGFQSVQHAVSLPPSEAFRKLFARFPIRPTGCLAPSQRNSPQAICTVSSPSSEALPKLFARFPVRPACCLASSQRSFPQAICTVSSPYSMLSRSLPAKLSASFSTVSSPSSMLPRSLPAKLSVSYFHRFLSVQHAVSLPPSEAFRKLFARFPVRRACCLAPSQRSFPQAICTVSYPSSMLSRSLPAKLSPSYFHGFLSVQHAVSLSPREGLPKLFATVSSPSSMLCRSLPPKLSVSYLHGFQSVQHAVSLPPSEAFRKLFARFPIRPACCLAPSQRSSPQAISTVSYPSSMLSRSLPGKVSLSYLHGFQSVQHLVSLPPTEALRKLFARFPVRPACCLAPSQRSFPQAICTVSSPSSMLSRSLPAKLSPSYLHGFLSVQHAVSLPPSEALPKLFPRFPLRPACCLASSREAFRKLFARFPVRPACCLAPSQRSSP